MRRLVALGAAGLLALAVAAPASARSPGPSIVDTAIAVNALHRRVRPPHRRGRPGRPGRNPRWQPPVHGLCTDRRRVPGPLRHPRRLGRERHPGRDAPGRAAVPRRTGRAIRRRCRVQLPDPHRQQGLPVAVGERRRLHQRRPGDRCRHRRVERRDPRDRPGPAPGLTARAVSRASSSPSGRRSRRSSAGVPDRAPGRRLRRPS